MPIQLQMYSLHLFPRERCSKLFNLGELQWCLALWPPIDILITNIQKTRLESKDYYISKKEKHKTADNSNEYPMQNYSVMLRLCRFPHLQDLQHLSATVPCLHTILAWPDYCCCPLSLFVQASWNLSLQVPHKLLIIHLLLLQLHKSAEDPLTQRIAFEGFAQCPHEYLHLSVVGC